MSDEADGGNIDLTDFSHEQKADAPAGEASEASEAAGAAPPQSPAPAPDAGAAGEAAEGDPDQRTAADLEAVFDVPVNIAAILGRTNMDVSDLLKLDEGDVVELDRKVGEAIDIFVNNRLVARGEVVLVEERLGVTMTEIIKGESH
ncbi:MAG: hypothetical protein Kow0032_24140 [Methyloligellaceae bacterium]